MRVLVLGVTGMLGSAVFRVLSSESCLTVYGTTRSDKALGLIPKELYSQIVSNVDVERQDSLVDVFVKVQPNVVINCVGLVKQLADANNALFAIPINSMLPHRIAALCSMVNARLIHISTDCVFSGKKGNYLESDFPDADDLYGRSKLLGEVEYPNTVTLRTSIIGRELIGNRSLLNWFLSQKSAIQGYTRAIFSGFPTVEIANLIRDQVIPRTQMSGLYHVASRPINKFVLLKLIADVYDKKINIIPCDDVIIDRSLNSDRFNQLTGYSPPEWEVLINNMYKFN